MSGNHETPSSSSAQRVNGSTRKKRPTPQQLDELREASRKNFINNLKGAFDSPDFVPIHNDTFNNTTYDTSNATNEPPSPPPQRNPNGGVVTTSPVNGNRMMNAAQSMSTQRQVLHSSSLTGRNRVGSPENLDVHLSQSMGALRVGDGDGMGEVDDDRQDESEMNSSVLEQNGDENLGMFQERMGVDNLEQFINTFEQLKEQNKKLQEVVDQQAEKIVALMEKQNGMVLKQKEENSNTILAKLTELHEQEGMDYMQVEKELAKRSKALILDVAEKVMEVWKKAEDKNNESRIKFKFKCGMCYYCVNDASCIENSIAKELAVLIWKLFKNESKKVNQPKASGSKSK